MLSSKLKSKDLSKSPIFFVAPFFFLGTSMVVMKAVLPETTPLFLAGFRLVPAGLLILIVSLLFRLPQPKSWKAWLWIALFSLIDGAMFQGFLTEGLVKTGAGLGAVLIDAQPLVVAIISRILFSMAFLSEALTQLQWIGVALTLLSVVLVIQREAIFPKNRDESTLGFLSFKSVTAPKADNIVLAEASRLKE